MINEILDEKIAQGASDIDVVGINGYGWPAFTGGPMYWANSIDLKMVVDRLRSYQEKFGSDFTLSPLLSSKVAEGGRLNLE